MNAKAIRLLKAPRVLVLLLPLALAQHAFCSDLPAGKVVWWGKDVFPRASYSEHTNGVIESDNELLTNVIAIAAGHSQVLALKSDGTVAAFGFGSLGWNDVPSGLSNVVSVAVEGNSCWAIKRDGTVARWGNSDQDGAVLGFRLEDGSASEFAARPVRVRGQILSNVVALVSMGYTPLVLRTDGTVLCLGYQTPGVPPAEPVVTKIDESTLAVDMGGESRKTPYHYTSADPIMIGGKALNKVAAIAGGGDQSLALKDDGTIVAWSGNGWDSSNYSEAAVPEGLKNVTAIAADESLSLALKSDGTVVAWGANEFGQTSVPAGLSNVVAIAAGAWLSFALTTGNVPASIFTYPHGRLEEMEREADLIFKGQVISSRAFTNTSFPRWGNPHATQFRLLSALKGEVETNAPIFWHNTTGPQVWGGGRPPSSHEFEVGESYLVFAARLDRPDYLYSVPSNAASRPNEFRQLCHDGVMRTMDARPVASHRVKDAHWLELQLLLNDANPTNQLYAIAKLDSMSLAGRRDDEWTRSDDFKRKAVLTALLPLATNQNEQLATQSLRCFGTETAATVRLAPFTGALVQVARESPSPACRLEAISALSGTESVAVSNSLAQLLKALDENIRVGAVRLLMRFPKEFAEEALRERAGDKSANVRSVVADIIGDGSFQRLLPTLAKLFTDPVGRDPLIKPLSMEYLRAGERWSNIGDVHTSAGLALVKFAPEQVADNLRTNLGDPGFHINFVSKLAEKDAAPWLPELVGILEARLKYVDEIAKSPPLDPRRFADPAAGSVLIGTYAKCWEDIREYLLKLPPEKLVGGEMSGYMDLLDKTVRPVPGCPGCCVIEARSLYELYRIKGLTKRAAEVRHRHDKTDGWWFDDFDRNH